MRSYHRLPPGAMAVILGPSRRDETMGKYRISAAFCLLAGVAGALWAQGGPAPIERKPAGPPFRIADNLYHVGASDSAVYLIAGRDGLILLDGGFPEDAEGVLANVRALGFDPKNIRLLLISQAHQDHGGGLAAIKAATGARLLASREDSALLERGGLKDPQFGDSLPFPPVRVDRFVADRERVTLGDVTLTAHLTPGHTPGCTTWSMKVRDGATSRDALFVCGATAPGYRLIGNDAYPDAVGDFEMSFARWRGLKCELFLGAHGSYFGLERKRGLIRKGRVNPFVDPAGCRGFLARAEKALRAQVARERAAR